MSKTKIWITGAKGGLGSTICEEIDTMQYQVLTSDTDVDISDMQAVSTFMEMGRPDVIINCAGYAKAADCEADIVKAFKVNAIGARNLAGASRKIGAKMIHISTDDVFAGDSPQALTEFDIAAPDSIYGKSKLAAENFVRELNPKHLIVRSSWVYGKHGHSFAKYVLDHSLEDTPLLAPNDQISSPTSARALARFILKLIDTKEYGIFHASCEGSCTRYEFAKTILEMAGRQNKPVIASFSGQTGRQARCTLLRNLMMEITEIYKMPDWRCALKEYIEEWQA